MDLSKIVAIPGKPGLFKVVGEIRNGMLVESLEDGKRFPAHGTAHVNTLQDITIYCKGEDVALGDILDQIYKHQEGKEAPDYKSESAELKTFFEAAVPDYDQERVYNSDIKKVVRWYNILVKNGLLKQAAKDKKAKKEDAEPVVEKGVSEKKAEKRKVDNTSKRKKTPQPMTTQRIRKQTGSRNV